MYKLIAIDVDGTLLRSDHTISEVNINAIQKAKRKGVQIVLSTGRPTLGVIQFLKPLGLLGPDDYVVGYNGALIEKALSREIVSCLPLTGKDYKSLHKTGIALGVEPYAFEQDVCISTAPYYCAKIEAQINGIELKLLDINDIPDAHPLVKVIFSGMPDVLDQTIPKIPNHLYSQYTTMRSNPYLFEFLRKDINKGAGVAILARRIGVAQEEVMCIGDSGNDVHMIAYAGLGVAMGNAVPEAKQAADFITRSNDEDGVAYAIETFIL